MCPDVPGSSTQMAACPPSLHRLPTAHGGSIRPRAVCEPCAPSKGERRQVSYCTWHTAGGSGDRPVEDALPRDRRRPKQVPKARRTVDDCNMHTRTLTHGPCATHTQYVTHTLHTAHPSHVLHTTRVTHTRGSSRARHCVPGTCCTCYLTSACSQPLASGSG